MNWRPFKAGWEAPTVFYVKVKFIRIEPLGVEVTKLCYEFPINYKIKIPRSLSHPLLLIIINFYTIIRRTSG